MISGLSAGSPSQRRVVKSRQYMFHSGRVGEEELDDAGMGQVLLPDDDSGLFPDFADDGFGVALPRFDMAANAHDLARAEPGPFQPQQDFGAGACVAEQET